MAEDTIVTRPLIDESSKTNRNLQVFFLLFLFYVIITVNSTTDMQLLLPNSQIKMPLLQVEIDLFAFYIIAPLLLALFHMDLLFNLLQHARKLAAWKDENMGKGTASSLAQFPFLYNFYFFGSVGGGLSEFIVWLSIWAVYFMFPLMALCYVQVRFSEYQSWQMTLWHFSIFAFDFSLMYIYWPRLMQWKPLQEGEGIWALAREHAEAGLLAPLVMPFKFIAKGLRYPIKYIKDNFSISRMLNYILTCAVIAVVLFSLADMTIIVLLEKDLIGKQYISIIPRLNVSGKTIVASSPSDAIVQAYIMKGLNEEDAWVKRSGGVNLKERRLRYADLSNSKLINANLYAADLRGANLFKSYLRGVELIGANLHGADLSYSDLSGSNLSSASLRFATLWYATLRGVVLESADLRASVIQSSDLSGSNLWGADLRGAMLGMSDLRGATLGQSKIQCALGLNLMQPGLFYLDSSLDTIPNYADLEKGEVDYIASCKTNEYKFQEDWDTILNERLAISCEDEFVARGMLSGSIVLSVMGNHKAILSRMETKCRDILEKIDSDFVSQVRQQIADAELMYAPKP